MAGWAGRDNAPDGIPILAFVGVLRGENRLSLATRERGRRMPAYRLEWISSFEAARQESLHAAAEAFFCSYPRGEYVLESRERYRVVLRRGKWVRRADGTLAPARASQFRIGDYAVYPMVLRVLILPRANGASVTLKHEVVTPAPLSPRSYEALSEMVKQEWAGFHAYSQQQPPVAEDGRQDKQAEDSLPDEPEAAQADTTPASPAAACPVEGEQPPFGLPAARSRTRRQLSAWWPASPTGIVAFCIFLVLCFFAPMLRRGAAFIDGVVCAGLWYFIVVLIRHFAVVRPSRNE